MGGDSRIHRQRFNSGIWQEPWDDREGAFQKTINEWGHADEMRHRLDRHAPDGTQYAMQATRIVQRHTHDEKPARTCDSLDYLMMLTPNLEARGGPAIMNGGKRKETRVRMAKNQARPHPRSPSGIAPNAQREPQEVIERREYRVISTALCASSKITGQGYDELGFLRGAPHPRQTTVRRTSHHERAFGVERAAGTPSGTDCAETRRYRQRCEGIREGGRGQGVVGLAQGRLSREGADARIARRRGQAVAVLITVSQRGELILHAARLEKRSARRVGDDIGDEQERTHNPARNRRHIVRWALSLLDRPFNI
ncbi:hypothetical protein C8J57DRAFT_1473487 [Mycena rebaudengoi]|nr:hypothetical protein C8J57DRAFT_1473487 [Mycena rebaudengoi]